MSETGAEKQAGANSTGDKPGRRCLGDMLWQKRIAARHHLERYRRLDLRASKRRPKSISLYRHDPPKPVPALLAGRVGRIDRDWRDVNDRLNHRANQYSTSRLRAVAQHT